MTPAEGYYDSMYGRINSKWEVNNGQVIYSNRVGKIGT
ncbi:MAG: hypothetical protein JXR31_13055 [Prolixibacteraceae bacterium]|nr:hypothetical protein [Prolixibacteraceae bacterium]MBN2775178.1 hypothetical protein [Prolixibacteraceae bacterium]